MNLNKVWTLRNKQYHIFIVDIEGNYFEIDRNGSKSIWDFENYPNKKQLMNIYIDDIPNWANQKIESLKSYTEQFEIVYTYLSDKGIQEKKTEYINTNCFKWDCRNIHELAKNQFLNENPNIPDLKIISVTYC